MRYWAGIVTDEMLALPKWRFMAIGALEALGVATGMSTREDCLVARRNGNGRGKIDGDTKINHTHRERPCLGRRAVNPEPISFLDSDSDYVSSRPGLEVFRTRYYRHARHPSPEGFAEVSQIAHSKHIFSWVLFTIKS